jgi:hypothetical protein
MGINFKENQARMDSWIGNPDSGCIYEVLFAMFLLGDNTDVVETSAIKLLWTQGRSS